MENNNLASNAVKVESISFNFKDESAKPIVLKVSDLSIESLEKIMFVLGDSFDININGNQEIV